MFIICINKREREREIDENLFLNFILKKRKKKQNMILHKILKLTSYSILIKFSVLIH